MKNLYYYLKAYVETFGPDLLRLIGRALYLCWIGGWLYFFNIGTNDLRYWVILIGTAALVEFRNHIPD